MYCEADAMNSDEEPPRTDKVHLLKERPRRSVDVLVIDASHIPEQTRALPPSPPAPERNRRELEVIRLVGAAKYTIELWREIGEGDGRELTNRMSPNTRETIANCGVHIQTAGQGHGQVFPFLEPPLALPNSSDSRAAAIIRQLNE